MKNKSNKELARNKEVALTKEQIKRLYEYQPTGTENKFKNNRGKRLICTSMPRRSAHQ